MAKATDMKILQQQVAKLWTQQQKRTNKVVELQAEEKKFLDIIYPIHEKVLIFLGSMGLTTLEHLSSKLVENLKKLEARF